MSVNVLDSDVSFWSKRRHAGGIKQVSGEEETCMCLCGINAHVFYTDLGNRSSLPGLLRNLETLIFYNGLFT